MVVDLKVYLTFIRYENMETWICLISWDLFVLGTAHDIDTTPVQKRDTA